MPSFPDFLERFKACETVYKNVWGTPGLWLCGTLTSTPYASLMLFGMENVV